MKKSSVLIVEDHQLLRETWEEIINAEANFIVVGQAESGEQALQLASSLRPDIIMMDINLRGLNGIEATKLIRKTVPTAKIIGVSLFSDLQYVRAMLKAGASGYLTKNASTRELIKAFDEMLQGRNYISSEIRDLLSQELTEGPSNAEKTLTPRERQIIGLIKEGHSSKEIADQLYLSVKTVEVHRYNILRKLNLKNTAALVDYIHRKLP